MEFSSAMVEGDKRKKMRNEKKKIFGTKSLPYYCVHYVNLMIDKNDPP